MDKEDKIKKLVAPFTGSSDSPESPWDPGGTFIAPWSVDAVPSRFPSEEEFFLAIREDKTCDVFDGAEDAHYFLGKQGRRPNGTVFIVSKSNRLYPDWPQDENVE